MELGHEMDHRFGHRFRARPQVLPIGDPKPLTHHGHPLRVATFETEITHISWGVGCRWARRLWKRITGAVVAPYANQVSLKGFKCWWRSDDDCLPTVREVRPDSLEVQLICLVQATYL